MPSIEFIIKANYKEVDKAIKKIEDLKKIISSMKDTDPGMEKLEAEYREAQETIKKFKPKLAICVYHRKEDLWEIPILLKSFVPEYKLFLNHYTLHSGETVLFATA